MRMLIMQRKKAIKLTNYKAKHKIKKVLFAMDNLVLLYNKPRYIDIFRNIKLKYKWLGLYLVNKLIKAFIYKLKEIDETKL